MNNTSRQENKISKESRPSKKPSKVRLNTCSHLLIDSDTQLQEPLLSNPELNK
jgi:hypothetical protein